MNTTDAISRDPSATRFGALIVGLCFVLAVALTGCTGSRTQESTGEYIDDSVITTKVKAALVDRLGADSTLEVSVETFKGTVQLGGFVASEAERTAAGSAAASVEGVVDVQNGLSVK